MPAPIALAGFQILPENRSAARAVKSVIRGLLHQTRPSAGLLVLHGPPGTGKTCLANAMLGTLTAADPPLTARVVSAAELARPDSQDETTGFADPDLRSCDVLVLEDVQHLPERAADAACELLDARTSHHTPVIVTATTGPAGLTHLPRRLTSRLAAGLVVQLEPLSVTSRRLILAKAAKVRLTADALDWLAAHAGGLRSALGMLQNLILVAPNYPGPLDRPDIEKVLAGTGQPTSRPNDLAAIMKRVTTAFGITEKELRGASRLRTVLLARQVAMFLAREVAKLSLPRIGAAFGRDHSTVLHACRKVETELETDAVLNARVRQLRAELG